MTIRFVQAWNGYYPGQIVTNPNGGNSEATLVALGYAVTDLNGPDNTPVPVTGVINEVTGGISFVSGGNNYETTLQTNPVVMPDETYTAASSNICVVAGPCKIISIVAQAVTTGPLTFTIYDNSASGAGTVLWTESLNTGGIATIPTPILAMQGVFLSFTGTATLDITVRGFAV